MRTLQLPVIGLAMLAAYACQKPAPPIPVLPSGTFSPVVWAQMERAYQSAAADPSDAAASGEFGIVLHAYGLDDGAVACYQRAIRLGGASPRWPYYLGMISFRRKQFADAAVQFQLAVERAPSDAAVRLHLADALSSAGRPASAKSEYELVLSANPNAAQAQFGLGRLAESTGQIAEAARRFEQACTLAPEYRDAQLALAKVYRGLGEKQKADAALAIARDLDEVPPPMADPLREELAAVDRSTQGYIRRSIAYERSGRVADAIQQLEQGLLVDDGNLTCHVNLISLLAQTGKFDGARLHYQRATTINPKESYGHFYYANALAAQQKFAEAAKTLAVALEINPQLTAGHVLMGDLQLALGNKADAEREYRAALASRPNDPVANRGLGLVLSDRRLFKEAIPFLERSLAAPDPLPGRTVRSLANAYRKTGQSERAVDVLSSAEGDIILRGTPSQRLRFERELSEAKRLKVGAKY